ncbi:MAG: hypothetical protein A2W61_05890 [Deltaproteobacteria bacterium RIFCSPLOWO2_01_44_7]|nr:MAG: hypothetical protein A2712_03155 [Deltaproteobacteria bacterium RIFCSPHIGHO2_01_FULL_43_49]OGQ16191.1 MAG: hypothetical protein A3D22_01125 [Deltaproteobacteria bacterium RIFCSPHIGHO2_02_FULL_44_53]OGQ29151.1 MAG: hypothetical protein A3D98_04910 [Deltaproteobacteria bacterium RIFCSPHIGHO2_12_FULL_44_21]OGQ32708.1 MAG: hypothetical protein A2979_09055 [Deltaproteobacteria bacterium RIFCSPLOWO2_01_FULL_45_74]OGQ37516.1 MAG: hypothetical protein A2W61_05890 [Deltaproteobacteria bacterium 
MGGLLKQYLWVLDLVTILFCSFFAAKLTSVYLSRLIEVERPLAKLVVAESTTTAARTTPPASDYKIIVERNIFDSTELPPEEPPPDVALTAPITGEALPTTLGIKVMGVLVVGKGVDERSSATIEGGQGGAAVDTYAVGTENGFAPGTKLTKVKPDRIEFIHNGRLEYALVEDEGGESIFGPPPAMTTAATPVSSAPVEPGQAIKKTGENKFVIDQKEVQNALINVDQLYTEIRAVPNFAGGKVSGMKILSVKQGSIFDKLGLQRGDILEKINGQELDVKRGFEIFGQLKDEKRLTLDLVRQGANQSFEYEIR